MIFLCSINSLTLLGYCYMVAEYLQKYLILCYQKSENFRVNMSESGWRYGRDDVSGWQKDLW